MSNSLVSGATSTPNMYMSCWFQMITVLCVTSVTRRPRWGWNSIGEITFFHGLNGILNANTTECSLCPDLTLLMWQIQTLILTTHTYNCTNVQEISRRQKDTCTQTPAHSLPYTGPFNNETIDIITKFPMITLVDCTCCRRGKTTWIDLVVP